jgi:hypothetical protein
MTDNTIPNTSEALEQAVLDRLTVCFPGLVVEPFPDDPDSYRLNHPVGALLLRYHGSKYGPLLDTGLVVQERAVALEVTLVFRCLNGKDGVYAHLEAVRQALAGFKPPAFAKLKPIGEEFLSQGGGEWRYAIDFATTTTVVEVETPEDFPVVTKMTFTGGSHDDFHVPRAG